MRLAFNTSLSCTVVGVLGCKGLTFWPGIPGPQACIWIGVFGFGLKLVTVRLLACQLYTKMLGAFCSGSAGRDFVHVPPDPSVRLPLLFSVARFSNAKIVEPLGVLGIAAWSYCSSLRGAPFQLLVTAAMRLPVRKKRAMVPPT